MEAVICPQIEQENASKRNVLFGVKGEYNGKYVIMKTWEVINGRNVQVDAKFRKYPTWYESMQDLAKLYVNGVSWDPNHYKAVVGEKNYKKAQRFDPPVRRSPTEI